MSEQDTQEVQEEQQQTEVKAEATQQEVQTKEPSSIEVKAMEMGWRPKEDFDGDEEDFIDAQEFVRRKPLFDKIEHQSKELKEVKKILRNLQDHHTKVKEVEFKRAVDYLKAQKRDALEAGDHDRVVELDDQLVDIRAAQRAAEQVERQPKQPEVHPDFTAWVNKNSWYAQDSQLRSFADALGVAYAADNPELKPAEVLKYVTTEVRRAFPKKFQNPERTKPAAVDGSNTPARPTKPADTFELSEEEERVMKSFVRAGIMTAEDYKKELKAMRG